MRPSAPVLVLAAHPDDETLGASALLAIPGAAVAHLTDGAPRDGRFRPPAWRGPAEEYALARRGELYAALAVAGLDASRAHALGAPDQEALAEAVPLARRLAALLAKLRPRRLVTHAYEGGHPDHDAAALVARGAVALLARAGLPVPRLHEMALYHGAGGRLAALEFLPGGPRSHALRLDAAARARKRAMLARHATQRELLEEWFPAPDVERLRRASAVDFSRPPHEGPLWYERMGFATSGARWRAEAARAALAIARERLPFSPAAPPGPE